MVRCGHSIRVKIQLKFYLLSFTFTGKISPKELQKRHEKLLFIFHFYWVIINNHLIYSLLIIFITGYLPIYLSFIQYVLEGRENFLTKRLLAKPRSFSDLPSFLGPHGYFNSSYFCAVILFDKLRFLWNENSLKLNLSSEDIGGVTGVNSGHSEIKRGSKYRSSLSLTSSGMNGGSKGLRLPLFVYQIV